MINEAFEIHDELNPKIWTADGKLLPDVEKKILEIVEEFCHASDVELDVVDIEIVGSNASYNYTVASDLDVHIITNFETYDSDPELVNAYFNAIRSNFKAKYDITIKGMPVELYVEDINSGVTSNGIYSILQRKWIKFPKKLDNIEIPDLSSSLGKWQARIDTAIATGDKKAMDKELNFLYLMRKNSIAADGEYGLGNLIFKAVRDAGLLDKLKLALQECTAKRLSLESYRKNICSNLDAISYLNFNDEI